MKLQYVLFAVILIAGLLIAPVMAVPSNTTIIGFRWDSSNPSPILSQIDKDGNVITVPATFFDDSTIWGNIKTCVVAPDGTISYGTNNRGDGLDLTGASGDVMVEIPRFYTKDAYSAPYFYYWISPLPETGYTVDPMFNQRMPSGSSTSAPYWYVARYFGNISGGNMTSVTGKMPTTSITIGKARSNATSKGPGWGITNIWTLSGIRKLFYTEMLTLDSQNSFPKSRGIVNDTASTIGARPSGADSSDTNIWANNGTGSGTGANGWTPAVYRNMESITGGNVWEFQDGFNAIQGTTNIINRTGFNTSGQPTTFQDLLSANDVQSVGALPTVDGYQTNLINTDIARPLFLPAAASGGSDITYLSDFYYYPRSITASNPDILLSGGAWINVGTAGVGYLYADADASFSLASVGARLEFRPPETPIAYFTVNTTGGIAPLAVLLTDTSTNDPSSWKWMRSNLTFPSGEEFSTVKNPEIVLPAGNYTINLTATNAGGSNTSTQVTWVNVTDVLIAAFTQNKTSGASPLSVAFTDTSSGYPNIWVWSVNGTEIQNSSITKNFVYTFYPVGDHRINLTVWNTTLATAPSTASRNVTVNASIVADFAGAPTSGFATLPVSFVDMSTPADIYAWYWEFGDGSNSTERNPTHSYTSAGLYTVNLTATNVDGSDTESKIAYIDVSTSADPNPNSTLKFKPDLNIIGNQSRYNQTIQIQNVSIASYVNGSTTFDPSHLFATKVYANTSTYAGNTLVASTIDNTTGVVTWQVTNAGGYTAGSIPVSIIDIEMFQKSYAVGSITQSPGSGNLGNATYNTSHAIVYSESANFAYAPWITYSNFTISNYNPVIFEDTVTFTPLLPSNITADRWLWDFGDGNSTLDTTGGPVTYKYMTFSANTTLYPKLTAYLAANTSVTNTTTLTISPVYNVSFVGAAFSGSPLTGNAGLSVSFTDQSVFGAPESTNPRSYNWSFGDGAYSDIKGGTSHVYTALGTYTVSLSVGNSYGNSTETKVNYIIISNSQQTTWYSPKQIGITAVYRDPAGIRIPNASMTLRAIGSTIPATATTDTQQSLQLFYGINPTAANLMMNNTLIMAGTTGGDGSASFTVLASISYQVNITDPKTGVVWSSDISPSDPLGMYTIWVGNTPFAGEANTTINYLNQTKLYITQPDPGNVTFNLIYKDTSGLTTDVIFEIIAANNKTRVYGVDLGNPGTSAVLANYTLPNVIDNTYYFGYNATRSE